MHIDRCIFQWPHELYNNIMKIFKKKQRVRLEIIALKRVLSKRIHKHMDGLIIGWWVYFHF